MSAVTDVLPRCPVTDKPSYANREEARRAMRHIGTTDRLRAYRCPLCDWWHHTHQRRGRAKL